MDKYHVVRGFAFQHTAIERLATFRLTVCYGSRLDMALCNEKFYLFYESCHR